MTTIRLACEEDASALLSIYRPYVEATAITFELETPSETEFARRIRAVLASYPYLVACNEEGSPIGYAYANRFRTRAAYDWCLETSIYVAKESQGTGTGRRLYQALEELLSLQNVQNLIACIASSSAPDPHLTGGSVAFHKALGYKPTGTIPRCGLKFGTWYDLCLMQKMLPPSKAEPKPVVPFAQLSPVKVAAVLERS